MLDAVPLKTKPFNTFIISDTIGDAVKIAVVEVEIFRRIVVVMLCGARGKCHKTNQDRNYVFRLCHFSDLIDAAKIDNNLNIQLKS
jgi:hypothetical protein